MYVSPAGRWPGEKLDEVPLPHSITSLPIGPTLLARPRRLGPFASWPNEPVITLIATPRKEDGVGKHDLNSLVLCRPQMSTRKRRNRSLGLYGLPRDFAMRGQGNSLRIRARLMFAMRLYSITRQCAPSHLPQR